ncbi:hypothetical protein PPERSA_08978 [Pseudocohnilembus persalinus]|uniref:2,4-dienoyl-CoA reductase [(3E)-enoyl-CoA-producing] n=1 Tax=Pseudocohnilembus persalinus TaxID=266149 RepID=A0A0V0R3D9_PSEPJ|nr:hypothetical protein PPERSA_08978 [Pseudocohnilembus persalinus]|eukprot:KRX08874.1 hypothetical protein PPERSA_08978 [Pseudocohnilembus persalinus]
MSQQTFQPEFLKGKIAFVTGGATGICYQISLQLAQHGAKVCIMSRKQEAIDKAVESLKKESGNQNIFGHTGDVRKTEQIEKAVEYFVQQAQGEIDILVNGAAGNFMAPFSQISPNAFKTVIDIDLLGTFNTTKVVFTKSMSKLKQGSIINISAWLHGCVMQSHASAAKAGIDSLTKGLAVELGPRNIRVNAVVPGSIEGTEGFSKLSKGIDGKIEQHFPIQRMGKKSDIANMILFLTSEASSYITGQILVVDGGAQHTFPNFGLLSNQIKNAWVSAKL